MWVPNPSLLFKGSEGFVSPPLIRNSNDTVVANQSCGSGEGGSCFPAPRRHIHFS